jgi:hypothetical protein
MRLSLAKFLSVADSATDGVLLHVSVSSEGEEWGYKTGQMKNRTSRQTPQ